MLYRAFGLTIDSDIRFPELHPAASGNADVTLSLGRVPRKLRVPTVRGRWFQASPGEYLLRTVRGGRILVRDGRTVTFHRGWWTRENDLRGEFLCSAIAALLLQRGTFMLHASSIQTSQGAALFAGRCGAGKSTLLAALIQRGYPMLSDDISTIRIDADQAPLAFPAYPLVQLHPDTTRALNPPAEALLPPDPGITRRSVLIDRYCDRPLPVQTVYQLAVGTEPSIRLETLSGIAAFRSLLSHAYGLEYLDGTGSRRSHFLAGATLASKVRVVRVHRPVEPLLFQELADAVEADIVMQESTAANVARQI